MIVTLTYPGMSKLVNYSIVKCQQEEKNRLLCKKKKKMKSVNKKLFLYKEVVLTVFVTKC